MKVVRLATVGIGVLVLGLLLTGCAASLIPSLGEDINRDKKIDALNQIDPPSSQQSNDRNLKEEEWFEFNLEHEDAGTDYKPLAVPIPQAPDGISGWSVIMEAYPWLGVPYKEAGESKSGVDCSGLVRQVYMRASGRPATCYDKYRGWHACCKKGIGVCYYDRTAEEIRRKSIPVWPPQRGDIIIFVDKKSGKATHVGIYVNIGPNGYYWDSYFIHAGQKPGKVVLDRLYYSPYYGEGWWYKNFRIYSYRYNPDYWMS